MQKPVWKEVTRDAINIILTVALVGLLSTLVHDHIAEIKAQNQLMLEKIDKIKRCCETKHTKE